MDFRITCICGLSMTVSEAAAGSEVPCACGRNVQIPDWTELRRRAGLPRFNVSPELLIENILASGELPFDDRCIKCEEPTDQIFRVLTKCEQAFVKQSGGGPWTMAFAVLLGGIWGALLASRRGEDKTYGRDKVYWLPLRVCPTCLPTLRTEADIKLCLRAVPLYELLLNKFPDAEVSTPTP